MKHYAFLLIAVLLTACGAQDEYVEGEYVQNPDPNHTHADFAVYMDGEFVDFAGDEYMSGLSTDDSTHDEEGEYHHQHLHLHDNIGTVIHQHKPDLTLQEFFDSLDFIFDDRNWRMFVRNDLGAVGWQEMRFSLDQGFADMDQILITDSQDNADVEMQVETVTQEACMFSKTCPWKGDPPAENCIADPAVPCVGTDDEYEDLL